MSETGGALMRRLFVVLSALAFAFGGHCLHAQSYTSTSTISATVGVGYIAGAVDSSFSGDCYTGGAPAFGSAYIGEFSFGAEGVPSGDGVALLFSTGNYFGPGTYSLSGYFDGFGGYNGEPDNNCSVSGSSTPTTSITVPAPVPSTTSSALSPAGSVRAGQTVTLTVTATGGYSVGPSPTGTVVVFYGANVLTSATINPITSSGSTITSGVSFNFSTEGLAPGFYTVGIVYSGDSNLTDSSSETSLAIVPKQIATDTSLTINPTTLNAGQSVTLTATVSPTIGGTATTPTGTVTFETGTFVLGTATLNSSGVGTLIVSSADEPVGVYPITASYGGDEYNAASVSTAVKVTLNAATTTTVTANPSSVTPGSTVTFSAAVVRTATSGAPTGEVSFSFDGYTFGTAALNSNGLATLPFSTKNLPAGTYYITANYSGDSVDGASVSAAIPVTIQ